MPQEATLRIALEGAGGTGGPGAPPRGSPSAPAGPVDLSREAEKFAAEMGRLRAALDPGVVTQLAAQELALRGARKAVADAMAEEQERLAGGPTTFAEEVARYVEALEEQQAAAAKFAAEVERIAPSVEPIVVAVRVLDEEAAAFGLEMGRLQAALDPALVQQRVEQELALAAAREKVDAAMEAEREKQGPTPAQTRGWADALGQVLKSLSGTVGGTLGRLAGSVGNVVSAGGAAVPAAGSAAGAAGMAGAAGEAGSALAAIGAAAPYVAVFVAAVGAAVIGLKALKSAADEAVERYAPYNPQIAMAYAQAELTTVLADMRRSQALAPDLAKYLQLSTELQVKYEDAKMRLFQKALPLLTEAMVIAEGLMPLVEAGAAAMLQTAKAMGLILGSVDEIRGEARKAAMPDKLGNLSEMILGEKDWNPNAWEKAFGEKLGGR
jgi:hypothetical protein